MNVQQFDQLMAWDDFIRLSPMMKQARARTFYQNQYPKIKDPVGLYKQAKRFQQRIVYLVNRLGI